MASNALWLFSFSFLSPSFFPLFHCPPLYDSAKKISEETGEILGRSFFPSPFFLSFPPPLSLGDRIIIDEWKELIADGGRASLVPSPSFPPLPLIFPENSESYWRDRVRHSSPFPPFVRSAPCFSFPFSGQVRRRIRNQFGNVTSRFFAQIFFPPPPCPFSLRFFRLNSLAVPPIITGLRQNSPASPLSFSSFPSFTPKLFTSDFVPDYVLH